jgi:signal transduction histidine kinase
VSLILSGALTWALVGRLENQNAADQQANTQAQLNNTALVLRRSVPTCLQRDPSSRACVVPIRTQAAFLQAVATEMPVPQGDRLILLNRPATSAVPLQVVYDSDHELTAGTAVPVGGLVPDRVVGQTMTIGGQDYLTAALPVGGNRFVRWMVLASAPTTVAASATSQLVMRILISGGAALLLSIVVTLLLARAFTRPLNELKAAAEDIAAGNYARRVSTTAYDEIAVVGHSFNRMAEAVERSRGLQRDFLANVSHELKTPLTSLIGFSQALMDGSLRTEAEKLRAATILNEESQRVLRMSQELLDLARVESGQLHFEPQPLDLGALLGQEIDIVRQRAARRGLIFQLAVPHWLPPVLADPERVHQILDNLLDNAVKYAPERTDVWIAAEQLAGGRVRTTVRNRVGAHPPNPERMFDRFYRADPSRASGAGGVGLGLAISRELAIAQNGSLTASLDGSDQLSINLDLPGMAASPPTAAEFPERAPVRLPPPLPEARG